MKTTALYLLILSIVIIVVSIGCSGGGGQEVPSRSSHGKGGKVGTIVNSQINVGDHARTFRLVVPKEISSDKAVPILFAFHAYHGKIKTSMHRYTKLDQLAQKEGFILVYPNTVEPRWSFDRENNPDIAFFDSLLKYLASQYNVDLNRIYAAGMSNGAYFVNILASQRSETIAAIAAHSGELPLETIEAKRKYPVMIIHGAKDKIVKVSEGRKMRDVYKKEGHEVVYIEIPDLDHTWAWEEHDINRKIWAFFGAHPMRIK